MNAIDSTLDQSPTSLTDLPVPHRCPWWIQYILASPLRRWTEPAEKLVGPYVEPGMTVVDPGCGFGHVSLPLARMVGPEGRVLCVDVEPRAIEKLKRRATRAAVVDRIHAHACEPRDLGLGAYAGQVDLVTVVHTLHEFEDLPGFLAQVSALLKPAGRMLVIEPRGHVTPEQFDAMMTLCGQAGFQQLDPPTLGSKRLAALLGPPRP